VTFTQAIGGRHIWIVDIDQAGRARVVKDSGVPLVELIR
jgi:hypothetical protein